MAGKYGEDNKGVAFARSYGERDVFEMADFCGTEEERKELECKWAKYGREVYDGCKKVLSHPAISMPITSEDRRKLLVPLRLITEDIAALCDVNEDTPRNDTDAWGRFGIHVIEACMVVNAEVATNGSVPIKPTDMFKPVLPVAVFMAAAEAYGVCETERIERP